MNRQEGFMDSFAEIVIVLSNRSADRLVHQLRHPSAQSRRQRLIAGAVQSFVKRTIRFLFRHAVEGVVAVMNSAGRFEVRAEQTLGNQESNGISASAGPAWPTLLTRPLSRGRRRCKDAEDQRNACDAHTE